MERNLIAPHFNITLKSKIASGLIGGIADLNEFRGSKECLALGTLNNFFIAVGLNQNLTIEGFSLDCEFRDRIDGGIFENKFAVARGEELSTLSGN